LLQVDYEFEFDRDFLLKEKPFRKKWLREVMNTIHPDSPFSCYIFRKKPENLPTDVGQ
jgi:mRNA-degrading endonuclease YafQ of YafQ-DinJ toxin-antitoxin module